MFYGTLGDEPMQAGTDMQSDPHLELPVQGPYAKSREISGEPAHVNRRALERMLFCPQESQESE
jgi:hypothetical protein